ncbi:helix-turn-helix domain-containing protein [Cohnella sp. REN36]|uniref:methyltransferase family protein n=1 Tax=Cohnella sp. REN36 TaxID=2887347 RepID=UPI001D15BAAD|nr:helix-turn-helix domain-containing protein [Cohnella sp. REN36]MCC3374975.1 helix-turn-helix domain-containing protein [Cohnella sp. REN36]
MTQAFESAYSRFIEEQWKRSKGERRRRLEKHGHAEKKLLSEVWWPALGHFDGLVAEYEVRDFKDGSRFLDYAVRPDSLRINLETDGYGPHCRDLDRRKFADHLMRQNHLLLDGWRMLRFSHDDVVEKPRQCQQLLLQALGTWGYSGGNHCAAVDLNSVELAIMRAARNHSGPLSAQQVAADIQIHPKTASRYLRTLMGRGLLVASRPDAARITGYMLNPKETTRSRMW